MNSKDFIPCKYFVTHKKRNCKGFAKIPNDFCPEHSITSDVTDFSRRIPCPVDHNHSVYENKLASHLKKCNANKPKLHAFYNEKINAGSDSEGEDDFVNVKLNDCSDEEITSLICLILKIRSCIIKNETDLIYDQNPKPISEAMDSDFVKGTKNDKHTFQYINLIKYMDDWNMLNIPKVESHAFLEFGAGKGGFSHYLEKHLSQQNDVPLNNISFVLIDRQGVRNRFDARHKTGPKFERILMDIAHLDLARVDFIKCKKVSLISKHLCGTATDLTLRCLQSWIINEGSSTDNFKSMAIALCCHHKCNWTSYVNKPWIRQLGLTPRQFHIMTLISCWATCGDIKTCDTIMNNTEGIEKKEVGLICKRIIDLGRKYFIENELGMKNVCIKAYVDQCVTLENCALFVFQ